MIREWLLRRAEAIMATRPPDFEIGPEGDRYLLRWYLTPWSDFDRNVKPRNAWERLKRKLPNVYAHRFRHDDEDRALHDHPFDSCSIILKGGYYEVIPRPNIDADPLIARPNDFWRGNVADVAKVFRPEGSVTFRRAESPHRVVLLRRYSERSVPRSEPEMVEAVTLSITGFRRREWFFHCAKGLVPWQVFTDKRDRGAVGRGCE
jgi:hypothetical protein